MQLQPKDILPYIYKAVRNREHHQQQKLNCGTACCVAGDIVINHFPELTPYLADNEMGYRFFTDGDTINHEAMNAWEKPWNYSEKMFNLNSELAELIFHSRATVYSHLLAIFLIENDLDDLDFYHKLKDDYCYNTLVCPFTRLEIDGLDYTDMPIQRLLNDICWLNQCEGKLVKISPELQALLNEVEEFVPA